MYNTNSSFDEANYAISKSNSRASSRDGTRHHTDAFLLCRGHQQLEPFLSYPLIQQNDTNNALAETSSRKTSDVAEKRMQKKLQGGVEESHLDPGGGNPKREWSGQSEAGR